MVFEFDGVWQILALNVVLSVFQADRVFRAPARVTLPSAAK